MTAVVEPLVRLAAAVLAQLGQLPGRALLAAAPAALLVAVVAAALVATWARDPGRPTTPAWTKAQLKHLPDSVIPPVRHRHVAERAFEAVSVSWRHRPLHSVDRVPPEIRYVMDRPVVERARVLSWSAPRPRHRALDPAPRWARRAQLVLAARLRAAGRRCTLRPVAGMGVAS